MPCSPRSAADWMRAIETRIRPSRTVSASPAGVHRITRVRVSPPGKPPTVVKSRSRSLDSMIGTSIRSFCLVGLILIPDFEPRTAPSPGRPPNRRRPVMLSPHIPHQLACVNGHDEYATTSMALAMTTAGESHGPALVAIVTGLPAGLQLDRDAIQHDLWRRQQGYGRSPRQQIETDEVEVLAGLRQGRTLGTPLALVVWNRDHKNWAWGMSPWPPAGDPEGKGTEPVTLPRPGHADLAGVMKYDLPDVRDALERASARHTAAIVAAGAVAKALLAEIGVTVAGAVLEVGGARGEEPIREAIDTARGDRDTLGGIIEVRAPGVPPGLGSYATKAERLDARLAATLIGTQAVKGVEIGDGFALAGLRGSAAHDEILRGERGFYRETNHAGGIEAGTTNGEEVVVRAAMKPLPTLMRPLRSVDLESGEAAQALVERSDVCAIEALAVVAEAVVAFELAAAARDKFGGDSLGDFLAAYRAYVERIDWARRC
jgi:chorismate synthase